MFGGCLEVVMFSPNSKVPRCCWEDIFGEDSLLPTTTLPETNIFAPENGDFQARNLLFPGGPYFQGRLLLVSGSVLPGSLTART